MLPSAGHIFFCPFSDESLYNETDQKVRHTRQIGLLAYAL